VLNPDRVTFDGQDWEGVSSVEVNRFGERVVVEHADAGPHAVFADVPEQKVTVRVVQDLGGDDLDGPVPGAMGELAFEVGANASGARRLGGAVTGVVTSVKYSVAARGAAQRTVWLTAVSSDGVSDPVDVN